MSPRGAPDWYTYQPTEQYAGMGNLAELAARLDQRNIYDRVGDVIFWDDFETGFPLWGQTKSGTGAAIALDTDHPAFGTQCVILTAGSDDLRLARIKRFLFVPDGPRVGVSYHFAIDDEIETFAVIVQWFDGTNRYKASLRVDPDNGKWEILTTGSTWQTIDLPLATGLGTNTYYPIKLVIDISSLTYVRAAMGYDDVDLSDIAVDSTAMSAEPRIIVLFELIGKAGQNDILYIDNVRVTDHNPVS